MYVSKIVKVIVLVCALALAVIAATNHKKSQPKAGAKAACCRAEGKTSETTQNAPAAAAECCTMGGACCSNGSCCSNGCCAGGSCTMKKNAAANHAAKETKTADDCCAGGACCGGSCQTKHINKSQATNPVK